jgi:hypothetical protein
MSLINDALKKAARERAEEQGEIAPRPGGGRRGSRHGGPMQKQTLILIGAAAIILIVVSVVLTGMFMTGKPAAKPAAAALPTPTAIAQQPAAKIVIEAPVIALAVPTPTAAPTVAVVKPTPTPVPVVVQAAEPVAPAPKAPDTSQSHMDEYQAIVDGFHISGVRTAGAESKALVDGHIYKLNDIVDKKSGLRLVKVDVDHLTFTDRDGNTFVRTF